MGAFKFAIVIAVFTSLEACAATTPTSKVAVDYDRIFAKAQNEVLVTNILRASEREPLQFSTMGSVTGGVRNTGAMIFDPEPDWPRRNHPFARYLGQ